MGLLDFFKADPDPVKDAQFKRGLLDFGLNMMAQGGRPTGEAFGRAGLLAGEARQQRQQQEQMGLYRKAQLDEMTAQGEQRRTQVEAAKRAAERDAAFRASLGPMGPMQAGSMQGGPTQANAAQIGQQQPANWQALAMQYPEQMTRIKELADAGNLGRTKVARTAEVDDGRGGKATRQLDEYGRPVGDDMAGYVAPVQVNQGNQISFTKPTAGLSLPVSMSPSERDASARGWAGNRLAQERLAMDKSAPRGQFIETDKGFVLGDPRTGAVAPVLGADGNPLLGKAATRHLTVEQGKATSLAMRAIQSENQVTKMDGFNPGPMDRAAIAAPFDLGRGMASEKAQLNDTAKRNFISAILRKESGAAVSNSEFDTYNKMFFPQLNDHESVLADKKQQRDLAIEGLMAEAGPGRDTIDKNVRRQSKAQSTATAPRPGEWSIKPVGR